MLDVTTYPKIISLLVVLCIISVSRLRIDSSLYLQMYSIAIFLVLFLIYWAIYGSDNISSILFGYPERNLGLISFLIFVLTFLFARQRNRILNLNLLINASTLIALVFWIGNFLDTEHVFLQQFTYPKPNAINQNITSLFLNLGLISCILKIVETRKSMNFITLLYHVSSLLFILITLVGIGDKQTIIYLLVIVYSTLLYNAKITIRVFRYLHSFVLIMSNLIFWLIVSSTPIDKSMVLEDSSVQERINIARIGFEHVITKPLQFRLPDSTADLNLIVLGSTNNRQYVDNLHNVWLEVGSQYGWIPALAVLLLLSWSTLKVSTDLITKQRHFEKFSNGVIFALINVLYFSLFWTILHPITIFALGIIVGSMQLATHKNKNGIGKRIIELRERSGEKLTMLNSNYRFRQEKIAKYTSIIIIFLCLFTLNVFTVIDFQKKVNFKKTEVLLMKRQIQFDGGVEILHLTSLDLKDRNYLDYSGRQLAQLSDCRRLHQNLAVQEELDFSDQRFRNLKEWYRLNC